jgi:hypothetical protein
MHTLTESGPRHGNRWGAVALCLLSCLPSPLLAQGRGQVVLRGTVVDADAKVPLLGAYVSEVGAHTGALTDSAGHFALPVDRASQYAIQISQLGYHTLNATLPPEAEHRAFTVGLKPDPVEIEGLQVITDQLAARRQTPFGIARILREPDLVSSSFGSAYDLTRQVLPFARPCGGDTLCISSRPDNPEHVGKQPLKVCVDGRAVSSGSPEMETIDPRGLYLVEAYPREGRIHFFSRGYVERLAKNGQKLPPPTFECVGPDTKFGGG